MSKHIEKLLKEYPRMVQERNCLAHQLAHFKGVSAEDVIDTMYTAHHEGERVQTSGTSDKTAQIAMNYQERMEKINREWYEQLEKRFVIVSDELQFFESALASLSGRLPEVMHDLVVEGMTWQALADKYFVHISMIGKYRKKAISELEAMYAAHENSIVAFMLQ